VNEGRKQTTYKQRIVPLFWVIRSVVFCGLIACIRAEAFLWNGLEINPYGNLLAEYDDNITFLETLPLRDQVTHALAGIGLKRQGKNHRLALTAEANGQLFANHPAFNNLSEKATAQWEFHPSPRDHAVFENDFSNAAEPRSFADAFGRAGGRYFTLTNSLCAGYRHAVNSQWEWNLHCGHEINDYSADALRDSTLMKVGGRVAYAADSATCFQGDYGYSQRRFDPATVATTHATAFQLLRYLTPKTYGELQAGANLVTDYAGQRHLRPRVKATLTSDLDAACSARLVFEKTIAAPEYGLDVLESWLVSVQWSSQVTNRAQALVNLFYIQGTYLETDIQDSLFGMDIGGAYELTSNSTLNASYIVARKKSSLALNGYVKNTFQLGISGTF